MLKLFVWEAFSPSYTGGLAIAIAKNETEAKEMIIKNIGYEPSDWGILTIQPTNKPTAFAVPGGD